MKTKVNLKLAIALIVMLLAVVFNMNTVNAATNQEAQNILNEIPDELNINTTLKEEIDNIIINEFNLDVSKIVENITIPEEYMLNICFENANCLNFGTAWLTSNGEMVTEPKYITIHYKDEENKNATDEKIATDIITVLEETEFTYKYTGELTNGKLPNNIAEKQEQALLSDIKTKFDLDNKNAEAKIIQSFEGEENETFYYIGIFINNVYYGSTVGVSQKTIIDSSTTETIKTTDNETNIKLETDTTVVPENTVLETKEVKEEKTLNIVKESLKEISTKYTTFDITLKSEGVAIQPNGKVKISIPIPNDYDKTKLSVYRVAEDGTKTEYNTKVEGKFAVIETDHFSTYVLAEKNVTDTEAPKTEETPKVEDTQTEETAPKGDKDDTPKTGTIETIYYILPVMIISALGIIAFRRKETK